MATFNDNVFKNTFEGMQPITYSALVTLVNNSQLIPGKYYRITDYVTTTIQSETRVPGASDVSTANYNPVFDVIVVADTNNKLNENAKAIQRAGNLRFANNDLAAWELKYDINNNTNKYAWADSTNGKGVIYYMKDEFNNEAGYDFKSIQFKRYKITAASNDYVPAEIVDNYYGVKTQFENEPIPQAKIYAPVNYTIDTSDYQWYYTFGINSASSPSNATYDKSLNLTGDTIQCHDNKISPLIGDFLPYAYDIDEQPIQTPTKKQYLNNIAFIYSTLPIASESEKNCSNNTFINNCYSMSLTVGGFNNTFKDCYGNVFDKCCNNNDIENNYNILGGYCENNIINGASNILKGNNVNNKIAGTSNKLDVECSSNIIDYGSNSNVLGENSSTNTIKLSVYNTLGEDCDYNIIFRGNMNEFNDNCSNNIIYYTTSYTLEESVSDTVLINDPTIEDDTVTTSTDNTIYINNAVATSKTTFNDNEFITKAYVDSIKLTSITHSELLTKANNSQLIPGVQYRITDYVTTTVQSDTQSANHAFDVIVTADDVNKLNENARAIQHSGDTYFNGQKLESWEIKYCINNDTNRFAWADTTNGKGVIYWMKDEYGNECGYDFKNIQMKYYKITATTTTATSLVNTYSASRSVGNSSGALNPSYCTISTSDFEWRYTFDLFTNNTHKDYSLNNYSSDAKYCHDNKINDSYDRISSPDTTTRKQRFINIISFRNTAITSICHGNTFGTQNYNFSFGSGCYSNTFGGDCASNTFGNGYYYNTFGDRCYSITFGNSCSSNTFGNSCSSNTFGNSCYYNTFDSDCYYNTFGSNCDDNTFGSYCYYNTFGTNCKYNTFGTNCNNNTFGNLYWSNTLGNFCQSNTFGNNCQYNNLPSRAWCAIFNDSTEFKSPKFNLGDGDSDYGFISSGDIDTSDTSNPKIYVYSTAFNIGDFDITVQIPYAFSGDITAKTGSSLTGTYTLTVPANDSVNFEISAIVSSVEEAEGSWEFDAEFDYVLGTNTNIHYVGHYEY